MKVIAYHGTTVTGLRELRGLPGRNAGYLCGLGSWLSEDARVAEFFARLGGESRGLPMLVYEVEVELGARRAYGDYTELKLDLALNPLRSAKIYSDYDAWRMDGCPERAEADQGLGHDGTIERFRQHLLSCGTTGISIEDSTTDLPIRRRDICALIPSTTRIVSCHALSPIPDGPIADHRELGRWVASGDAHAWRDGTARGLGR